MPENEPMTLKLPASELKNVDKESMKDIRRLKDEDIRKMIPVTEEETIEESPAPKKRGRKPKEVVEQEQLAEQQQMVDDLKPVVQLGLEVICKRMPNPIPLSDLELDSFTKAFDLVARKHFAKLAEHSAEAALIGASLFIIVPRLIKEKAPAPVLEKKPLDVLSHAATA